MSAITVSNVSKKFRLPHHKRTTFFQNAVGLVKRQMTYEEFWALKDISFEVEKGETFGIIGRNGSGKSTLLKILARVMYPDSGSFSINGKVASFLELGVGFQAELTAADNIYVYASVLGMSRGETGAVYDQILDFAELRKFEDMKLKNFSSGMYTRLAFSTAVNCNPDIMLVDEALSVGDEAFQKKCMQKINEFREQRKTIIFVSHALDTVKQLCERAILINNGNIISIGNTKNVIKKYLSVIENKFADPENKDNNNLSNKFDPVILSHLASGVSASKDRKLIGADTEVNIDANSAANYFVLSRFISIRSGTIREIRIRCTGHGEVKIAIYKDNVGEPGMLLNAINSGVSVDDKWNIIKFPDIPITAGTAFWLAFCSNADIAGAKATNDFSRRFKKCDYSTFIFPNPAGNDFIIDTTYYDLIAGWG
jgi:lipopolysaccharide transport system ATP-binding protein